jgi:outer membrane lipoprotein-sorting protein
MASCLSAITSADLYQELIGEYSKIETFQADITQTSYYSEIDYTNISQGKIYHNAEKILIEYTSPKVEKISLADKLVKIYQEEDDRLIMTYADSSFVSLNMKYLLERIWDDELVEITESDAFYNVKVELSEQNSIANVEKIEFKIDKIEKLVQEVKYQDDSDNEVQVEFSNIILNEPLNDELWEIKTSEHTQIIDYRE